MSAGDAEAAGLARIGAVLRGAGLTTRALAAWAGTARIAALPARLEASSASAATPAAAVLGLFVAGIEATRGQLRALSDDTVGALVAQRLIDRDGERLCARVAIVPLGAGFVVCDRLDAPVERDLVCWPDDSSHHLATAIPPGRRVDWLDLGCGSAFAPIARPELAARIAGVDLNDRAVAYARLGAALSGISHIAVACGDVGEAWEPAGLVTCNAPIPDPSDRGASLSHSPVPEVWRRAEPGFFERLWPALQRSVRPGGLIVVHGACEAVLPVLAGAPGERVAVTYTPDGARGFAVAWWQPDGPDRWVAARRALTPDRPHVDPRDREDALAG